MAKLRPEAPEALEPALLEMQWALKLALPQSDDGSVWEDSVVRALGAAGEAVEEAVERLRDVVDASPPLYEAVRAMKGVLDRYAELHEMSLWVQGADDDGKPYWYNHKTTKWQWHDPRGPPLDADDAAEAADEQERLAEAAEVDAYEAFDPDLVDDGGDDHDGFGGGGGDEGWAEGGEFAEPPPGWQWVDDEEGGGYYFNEDTQESSWELPPSEQ